MIIRIYTFEKWLIQVYWVISNWIISSYGFVEACILSFSFFFFFFLCGLLQGQASLVFQMVNYPPAMLERQIPSLGQKGPLEKHMATHSSILAWRIPWTEESAGLQSMGRKESDTTEWLTHTLQGHADIFLLSASGRFIALHLIFKIIIHLELTSVVWGRGQVLLCLLSFPLPFLLHLDILLA